MLNNIISSFGVPAPATFLVDYLVVAGGGGGGCGQNNGSVAGAGGAGGLRCTVDATGGGGSLETALSQGVMLLIVYSIGLGVPFVLAGYFLGNFLIFSQRAKKYILTIQKGSGFILIMTGILILSSKLQSIGFYILELFPFLGKLG